MKGAFKKREREREKEKNIYMRNDRCVFDKFKTKRLKVTELLKSHLVVEETAPTT